MIDVTSINDEDRSRLSVSSQEMSVPHLQIMSRRVSEDWEGDGLHKTKKLKEVFLKIYDKMSKKLGGGSSTNRSNSEAVSDDETAVEDLGGEIYEIVAKQVGNQEFCEAVGVKPLDFGMNISRKSN